MLLAEVVRVSERVAQTRARLEKIAALSDCLRELSPDEIQIGASILAGELPRGRIGVGYAQLSSLSAPPVEQAQLGLSELDARLAEIAAVSGKGSTGRRKQELAALFARTTAPEQQFLIRLLIGELRQGAQAGLLTDAIARAFDLPLPLVRRAAMLSGNLAEVALAGRLGGAARLAEFQLALLRPVEPMLAQTAEDAGAVLERFDPALLEQKLDGARIQVHRAGDVVRVFSRQLNDVTPAVPEVVEAVLALPDSELVLDGEAIALDGSGRPRSFQTTMRRFGRRLDVASLQHEIPLTPVFFDCLRRGPSTLIDQPARERFAALEELLPQQQRVVRTTAHTADEAQAFIASTLSGGHEGVVAKDPESIYEAGRRGAAWLKLKPVHTLDLLVLAAEWGSGRRKGKLSNLHLGARDPTSGSFVMLGKTFKGMTDAILEWQTRELLAREVGRDGHVVYVRPELVVEIAFDGAQRSSHYPGGVALRFARLRRYRDDKTPAEVDTLDRVLGFLLPD
jgi:DNA ligase-1